VLSRGAGTLEMNMLRHDQGLSPLILQARWTVIKGLSSGNRRPLNEVVSWATPAGRGDSLNGVWRRLCSASIISGTDIRMIKSGEPFIPTLGLQVLFGTGTKYSQFPREWRQ
jgi:hypothetical protein